MTGRMFKKCDNKERWTERETANGIIFCVLVIKRSTKGERQSPTVYKREGAQRENRTEDVENRRIRPS